MFCNTMSLEEFFKVKGEWAPSTRSRTELVGLRQLRLAEGEGWHDDVVLPCGFDRLVHDCRSNGRQLNVSFRGISSLETMRCGINAAIFSRSDSVKFPTSSASLASYCGVAPTHAGSFPIMSRSVM